MKAIKSATRHLQFALAALAALLPATASTVVSDAQPARSPKLHLPPPPKTMPAEAEDKLAFCLFRELAVWQRGNIAFSPTTLEQLLLALRRDARGNTFAVLDRLPFAEAETARAQQLHLAANFFRDTSLIHHTGDYAGRDFLSLRENPHAAAEAINAWVDRKTEGLMPFIIRAEDIHPNSLLLAVSVCHLSLPWVTPFDRAATKTDTPFRKADGTSTPVAMMTLTDTLRYAEGDDWQAIALLYRDRNMPSKPLAFIGILPTGNAREFARWLTAEQYDAIRAALLADSMEEATVELPRLELGSRLSFKDCLALPAGLFTPGLELSSCNAPGLQLADLIQQCRISLNEERTVASAATGAISVIVGAKEPEPRHIRFDRPFIWAIDSLNGKDSPAFIGIVDEP